MAPVGTRSRRSGPPPRRSRAPAPGPGPRPSAGRRRRPRRRAVSVAGGEVEAGDRRRLGAPRRARRRRRGGQVWVRRDRPRPRRARRRSPSRRRRSPARRAAARRPRRRRRRCRCRPGSPGARRARRGRRGPSAALGPPIPVAWIVSSPPPAVRARVAPEPAGVVAHLRLLEQLLGQQQGAAGVADQDGVGGDRGGRAEAGGHRAAAILPVGRKPRRGICASRPNTPGASVRVPYLGRADEEGRGVHPSRGVRADPGRAARQGAARPCRCSRPRARGARRAIVEGYRGSSLTVNVRPKLKLEVVVEDKDKAAGRRDDPAARPHRRGRRRQDLRPAGRGGDPDPHRRGRARRSCRPTRRRGDPRLDLARLRAILASAVDGGRRAHNPERGRAPLRASRRAP